MRVSRHGVEKVRTERVQIADERRVRTAMQRYCFLIAVIADAEAASNDEAFLHVLMKQRQFSGAPGKTNLRAKIVVAGIVEVTADFESEAGQRIG